MYSEIPKYYLNYVTFLTGETVCDLSSLTIQYIEIMILTQ